LNIFTNVIYLL